jgi:glycosyltransferase involved in cell wall biosynthesis
VLFLLLNQYYPPDRAPTGRMLHDVARTLVERGHKVEVLCSRRGYGGERFPAAEMRDGVSIRRLPATGFGRGAAWRRLLDSISFALFLVPALVRTPRPDLVVALTTPPFLGVIASAIGRLRGVPHAHWLMDVYPDVLSQAGWIPLAGFVYRGLAGAARRSMKRARLVLTLGPMMTVRASYVARGVWVPLWAEADPQTPLRAWPGEPLVLLWAGNFGRGHRFDDFLAAAERLGPAGPLWVFAGQGRRGPQLESAARSNERIRVLDSVDSLGAGSVLLASIAPGWEGLIVPHKVQGAFAAGRPLILVAGDASECAVWVRDSGGGWVVSPGDVEGLLAAIEEARDPAERARRGERALAYARRHFDPVRNRGRVASLFETAVRRAVTVEDAWPS